MRIFTKTLAILLCLSFHVAAQEGLDEVVELHSSIEGEETPADTAEIKPWKYGGNFSLTFNQVSLTNWVAGGENAISGNAGALFTFGYQKDKVKWENILDLGYGLTRQGEDKMIKNEDKIDFSSKYGRRASEQWFYSSLLGFKTQFDEGYKSPDDDEVISNFMAPAYLLASIGMDYKPNDNFTLFLSPITGRMTVVNSEELTSQEGGAFGVPQGETSRGELGGFVKAIYKKKFMEEKISFRTKLELFSSYLDKPQNLNIDWEVSLNLKVGDYITARLQTHLIYDEDAAREVQFRELFGLGFSYNF